MSVLENIHYLISGNPDGRRWVFVHGLMGFLNNWQRITSSMAETECCLSYDQRGHGKSFKPESGYAPEDYAQDLKELTDALGWDRFILVGHSMGGRNVLVFASLFPEKVEKLIIEDIGPNTSLAAHTYYSNLLNSVPTPFATREAARDFFKNEFPSKVKTTEPPNVLASFLYANLIEKDGTWDWRFLKKGILESVQAGHKEDRWHLVESLRVPTLWLRGGISKELKSETFQKILTLNPMIQGVEIEGSGHWIHSEKPLEFSQAVKNFAGGF